MDTAFWRHSWHWGLAVLLFAVALGIRVQGIGDAPLDFHPVKQYRSALTARAFYYSLDGTAPSWQVNVADEALQRIGILGPPLLDSIAAAGYLAIGREALWMPKLISALAWVAGGFFLYLLARRLLTADGALGAAAFYLLLPFAVVASQSFQPDPLMIMVMIAAIYLIVLHDDSPTTVHLMWAGAVTSLAILIKPVSAFLIYGAMAAVILHRQSLRTTVTSPRTWIFVAASMAPSFAFYGYSIFFSGSLADQADRSFVPSLLIEPSFWDAWAKRVRSVTGFTYLVAGLAGVLLLRDRRAKHVVCGLWIGYVAMCFAFTYTISTHDYYHLPLIPIVALGVGAVGAVVLKQLRDATAGPLARLSVVALALIVIVLASGTSIQARRRTANYDAVIGLAEEIGVRVGHSRRTILLAPHYGKPLMYYGRIAGEYWPHSFDIRDEPLWGVAAMTVQERFSRLNAARAAEYFIVTDLNELDEQQDLKSFLSSHFATVVANDQHVIFDLRQPITSSRAAIDE